LVFETLKNYIKSAPIKNVAISKTTLTTTHTRIYIFHSIRFIILLVTQS